MEVLSFDIEGKFAHFRKFHGNNTAMSYSIPPRTTIIGLLAAMVGEEKDSYYERYQDKNLKIGIRVMTQLKKSFHRLNLLMIKGKDDFRGGKGRVQTPFEVVTAYDINKDSVKYRLYIGAGQNDNLYKTLKAALLANERHFNLSLGIAGFSAYVSNIEVRQGTLEKATLNWVEINSACNSDQVNELEFDQDAMYKYNHVEEELLPADFYGGEKGREIMGMNRVLFATMDTPLKVELTGEYYSLPNNENEQLTENIQFLDYVGIFSQQRK